MIDTEVIRLRGLRNTVLKARAVAAALNTEGAGRDSVFSRSAVRSWQIARVITGWLRAHPYLSYQRDPSELRGLYDRMSADLLARFAHYRGRSLQALLRELQRVARELDDARALTWSSDMSDSLGRSQKQIRMLIDELGADVRTEAGSHRETVGRVASARNAREGAVAANWPYLAI